MINFYRSNFFYSFLIFIISISINQYFGFIGINPLDNFTIYNSGFLILNDQIPFNDFWVITGPLLDYFQAIFFKLFGLNWSAYVLHASVFNFLFSIIIFFSLFKFGLNKRLSFFYSCLTAFIFYPTVGTPFVDHHAIFFSITSILIFLLAINFKNKFFWLLLPIILGLGFFSKQTPTAYFIILIGLAALYYFAIYKDYKNLIFAFLSTVVFLLLTFLFFHIQNINLQFFYEQYIQFASSVGAERIESGSFLKPYSFSRYVIKFKLIHISYLSLFVLAAWKFFKVKNYHLTIEFITLLSLILTAYILIYHQLLTLNSKFIYCIIPMLFGFSNIYLEKYLKKKNRKLITLIILLAFCASIYNFNKYVYKRNFIAPYFSEKKEGEAFTTKIIDKVTELKWFSNLDNSPENEISNLKKTINDLILIQKKTNEKFVLITDYQFIFSSYGLKNAVFINKLYGNGISYPSVNNPNFQIYKKYFLSKIKNNNVKNIYIIKPSWFNEHNYALKNIFKTGCEKTTENKNFLAINIENCY